MAEGWPPKGHPETREQLIHRLRTTPTHLVRIRYFGGDDRWSVAFFTYSNEKYSPAMFSTGEWCGSAEDAFDIGAMYLGREAT